MIFPESGVKALGKISIVNMIQAQVKRHEGRLATLKKGNYLLKTTVDRLKDDLSRQREESITLQEDLDSVLAELG